MTSNVKRTWETETVDVPSTTVPSFVCDLYGGQSVTIKSLAGANKVHYIGTSKDMNTTKAFKLDTGETITLSLPASFGVTNYIEIWALAETAGEDVCYIKLIDLEPVTQAGD